MHILAIRISMSSSARITCAASDSPIFLIKKAASPRSWIPSGLSRNICMDGDLEASVSLHSGLGFLAINLPNCSHACNASLLIAFR